MYSKTLPRQTLVYILPRIDVSVSHRTVDNRGENWPLYVRGLTDGCRPIGPIMSYPPASSGRWWTSILCTVTKQYIDIKVVILTLNQSILTHWGRVTHICVSKLTIIGSHNGLSPSRRQVIIWTNAGLLLIWSLGIKFEIHTFSFKKMHLKMSSVKRWPFCLNALICQPHTFRYKSLLFRVMPLPVQYWFIINLWLQLSIGFINLSCLQKYILNGLHRWKETITYQNWPDCDPVLACSYEYPVNLITATLRERHGI